MARMSPKDRSKGREKVQRVMHEYKHGDLSSSSGEKVTDRDQAVAIALSEQRRFDKSHGRKPKSRKRKR